MRFLYAKPEGPWCCFVIRPRNCSRIANPILNPVELAAEFSQRVHVETLEFRKNTPTEKMNQFEWADWISPIVQVCNDSNVAKKVLGSYDKETYLIHEPSKVVRRDKVIAFAEAAAHPAGEKCNKRRAWFGASVLSQNLTGQWVRNNLILGRYVVSAFENWKDAETWIAGNY